MARRLTNPRAGPRRLGVTGSVAMGKTTAVGMLRRLGLPVHDADAVVHRLLGPGGAAVPRVTAALGVAADASGGLDRAELGRLVFAQPEKLKTLEEILHPLVVADRDRFVVRQTRPASRRTGLVVFDIPLLFETGSHAACDLVLVISAPPLVQRQRYLSRPGATDDRLQAILARQMPDAHKRRLADIVIPSGLGLAVTLRALRRACKLARRANHRHLARRAARRRLAAAVVRCCAR